MKSCYLFVLCAIFTRCSERHNTKRETIERQDTQVTPVEKKILIKPITYHLFALNKNNISQLRSIRSPDTLSVLFALNRVDNSYLLSQDTLLVPDTFITDIKAYAPFPAHLEELEEIHKIVFISYSLQAFGAYEHGVLTRWGPVSMGKEATPTPTGLFFTNWKSVITRSTDNPDWIMEWYFNLDNSRGVSIHEFELPGYPASHACIRMLEADAFWFYHWADQWLLYSDTKISAYGTAAIIFGQYSFGKRKPWLKLAEKDNDFNLTKKELLGSVQSYRSLILERQATRDSLITDKGKKEQ